MSESSTSFRKILLAGATGLVGRDILQALLNDHTVAEVHVLSRRALTIENSKLRNHIVDFQQLPALPPVDEVYLAIGTTIRVAGSRDAFRRVDFNANFAVAKEAMNAGAKRIALVSAAGADANSSAFYTRTKGELENALTELNPAALVIARPSLLLGDRDSLGQPPRLGEKIAIAIGKILAPLLPRNYRPVHAQAVARALTIKLPAAQGKLILNSWDLIQIGKSGND